VCRGRGQAQFRGQGDRKSPPGGSRYRRDFPLLLGEDARRDGEQDLPCRVPVVVTNNAPSAAGIDLARRVRLTLAGFVRPPRMNIYSVPERIIVD